MRKKAIKYRLRNIDNPVDSGKTMKVNDTFVLDANGNPYTCSNYNDERKLSSDKRCESQGHIADHDTHKFADQQQKYQKEEFSDRNDPNENWMRHWFELTHFLKLYGHANPSRKQFPTLADWVFQQRQRFRRQRLSLFRKKRLDDIGFEFDRSKAAKQNKPHPPMYPLTIRQLWYNLKLLLKVF